MRPIIKHGLIGIGLGIATYLVIHKHCSLQTAPGGTGGAEGAGGGAGGGALTGAALTDQSSDTATDQVPAACPDGYSLQDGQCTPNNPIQTPGSGSDTTPPPTDTTTPPSTGSTTTTPPPPPTDTTTTPPPSGQTTAPSGPCPAGYTYEGCIDTATGKMGSCVLVSGVGDTGGMAPRIFVPCPDSTTTAPTRSSGTSTRPTKVAGTAPTQPPSPTTTRTGARAGSGTNSEETPIIAGTPRTTRSVMADGGEPDEPEMWLLDDDQWNYQIGISKRIN